MNRVLKILAAGAMLASPFGSKAADTAPPPDTPVYPCWDIMKDGKMTPMRGMWHGGGPGNAQGGMMMHSQEVQSMQKEIEALRKRVMELQGKQPNE